MRKFTHRIKLLLLSASAFLLFALPARACVDYHTTVFVTCHYDTVNFTDIAIKVSNLRIFGGNPNDFCSCGITNYTDIFTNIDYVAFVDSGTTNPVIGFDPYVASANSTSAWESVLATGDWNGFVSGVNGNGLTPNAPVELIIRASLPAGYTYYVLDSNIYATQFGTDEWDNTNQTLANSHQSVSSFWSATSVDLVAEHSGSTYFSDLDNAVLTNLEKGLEPSFLEIGPVPTKDRLYVHLDNPGIRLETASIYNLSGQIVGSVPLDGLFSGRTELDVSAYPEGVYFLRIKTASGEQTKKFVIQH